MLRGQSSVQTGKSVCLLLIVILLIVWVCLRGCFAHVRVQSAGSSTPFAPESLRQQSRDQLQKEDDHLGRRASEASTATSSGLPQHRASDLDLVLLTERGMGKRRGFESAARAGGNLRMPQSSDDDRTPSPVAGVEQARGGLGDVLALASARAGLGMQGGIGIGPPTAGPMAGQGVKGQVAHRNSFAERMHRLSQADVDT